MPTGYHYPSPFVFSFYAIPPYLPWTYSIQFHLPPSMYRFDPVSIIFVYHMSKLSQSLSTKFFVQVTQRYGDGVGNTTEENSSVFSLIQMHYLLSARACRQQNCSNKIFQFLTGVVGQCRLYCIGVVVVW